MPLTGWLPTVRPLCMALSSVVEGVLVVATDGRLQHISPNVCRMLELRSKDLSGKFYWEAIGKSVSKRQAERDLLMHFQLTPKGETQGRYFIKKK